MYRSTSSLSYKNKYKLHFAVRVFFAPLKSTLDLTQHRETLWTYFKVELSKCTIQSATIKQHWNYKLQNGYISTLRTKSCYKINNNKIRLWLKVMIENNAGGE